MTDDISPPFFFDTSISDAEIREHKKTIPTGTQAFADIIKGGYLYVDKTPYISQWVLEGAHKTNLMHRPRRFGKTLTLSVIQEIYSHNKVLFTGTQLSQDFWEKVQPHPVISLTLAVGPESNPADTLDAAVKMSLIEQLHAMKLFEKEDRQMSGSELLKETLSRLSIKNPQNKAVILIDEYDSLLVRAYQMGESVDEAANVIAKYIHPLKYQHQSIHASYVIGIMKSRGLKLMSAVNNPNDQTFDPEYAQMIGFTIEEIQKYFMPEITKLSRKLKISIEDILQKIKSNYNGYVFNPENTEKTVYAANSFCNFVWDAQGFYDYWYSTGGIEIVYRRSQGQMGQIEALMATGQIKCSMTDLKLGYHANSQDDVAITTLLFYHGYLTFKTGTQDDDVLLHFPNDEVRRAFTRNHLEYAFKINPEVLARDLRHLDRYIKTCQIEELVVILSNLIAETPYSMHSSSENHYQNAIFCYLRAIYAKDVHAELSVAGGVIDLVVTLSDLVYVFELKYVATHATPAPLITALKNAGEQILSKRYFETYLGVKRLISLAIVISGPAHNIAGYQVVQDLNSDDVEASLQTPAEPILLPAEKIAERGLERAAEPIENLKKYNYSPAAIQSPTKLKDETERLKAENLRLQEAQEKQELINKLLKAEADALKADAEAKALKADAEAKALKADAEAKAREEKLIVILRLKSDGMSSQKICDILSISHGEWKHLTGENLLAT